MEHQYRDMWTDKNQIMWKNEEKTWKNGKCLKAKKFVKSGIIKDRKQ